MEVRALTIRGNGFLAALKCKVTISTPHLDKALKQQAKEYMAIWDTGATNTVITPKVVNDLGLVSTGLIRSHSAGVTEMRRTFTVDVLLPNKIVVESVAVTEATLTDDDDVLIGMDIIRLGDLAISNTNGKTIMSFRVPSLKEVDFVAESQKGPIPLNRHDRRELERKSRKQH